MMLQKKTMFIVDFAGFEYRTLLKTLRLFRFVVAASEMEPQIAADLAVEFDVRVEFWMAWNGIEGQVMVNRI